MKRIRILLVWLPTLLRDILSDAVAREPDMEIVATAETRVELETAVRSLSAGRRHHRFARNGCRRGRKRHPSDGTVGRPGRDRPEGLTALHSTAPEAIR